MKEKEIKNYMDKLHISREEAEELWLADNDYTENEEQAELNKKAAAVKVDTGVEVVKKPRKPREVKVSDEKRELFDGIRNFLMENYNNVKVIRENKMILVQINNKLFDLNFVEKRPPKK